MKRSFPIVVFLAALSIRLAYLLQIDGSPLFSHPMVDAETNVRHAERLASGNWLGRGEGPFWQPPLYPYVLGVTKLIFPESFFYAARIIQMLCGSFSCVLIWWIGRRLFSAGVGAIASLLAAFYGPFIYYDGELLPASLGVCLTLSGLGVLVHGLQGPSVWGILIAGAILGLAGLTVATTLAFVFAAAGYLLWVRRPRQAGVLLLGAALAIAPVTWRNWAIGRDLVLISYNAGVNFYIGNNRDSWRTLGLRPGWEWDGVAQLPLRAGIERPSDQSRYFFAKAWEFIRSEPLAYLRLSVRKLAQFWHGDEIGRNMDIYFWRNYSSILSVLLWKHGAAFPFGLVSPLALLGLTLSARRHGLSLALALTVGYALGVTAFFVTARYRLPLLPLLLILAAYGGESLVRQARAPGRGDALLSIALLLLAGVLVNWRLKPMDMQGDAAIHHYLGVAYARQGLKSKARGEFSRAIDLDPSHAEARHHLGFLKAIDGDAAGAAASFAQARELYPERPEISAALARAHLDLGDEEAAVREYQEALRLDPRQRGIYGELIALHVRRGDSEAVELVLTQAEAYFPREAQRWRKVNEGIKQDTLSR